MSLLILTNNGALDLPGRARFQMVDNMVDSILRRTAYRNFEIVVVDNSKLSRAQITRFASLGVRVENYTGRVIPFNYAAKANFALRVCRTEHLVMLNDDMEVINEDWLSSLIELSQEPEIGVVGGRLLHADGSIQHVGCVIGVNGGSAHVYHSFPNTHIGYNGFTHLIRNYSGGDGRLLCHPQERGGAGRRLRRKFCRGFQRYRSVPAHHRERVPGGLHALLPVVSFRGARPRSAPSRMRMSIGGLSRGGRAIWKTTRISTLTSPRTGLILRWPPGSPK